MCIIAVKPSSKAIFSDETINQMFKRNPDGAGLMWSENNKVYIRKGFMNVSELLDFVHSREWNDIPVVMHFRIKTSGKTDKMNCHPYPLFKKNSVNCTCKMGMAHNGILHDYNPPQGSEINDTQVFINSVINALPYDFMRYDGIKTMIEHEANPSRLAFLDKDGTIYRFGNWVEDDGYFFSNDSFRIPKPIYSVYPKWVKDEPLSFEKRFKSCTNDGFNAEMLRVKSKKEWKEIVDELNAKRRIGSTEDCIWESRDGSITYEMEADMDNVPCYLIKWKNTLF